MDHIPRFLTYQDTNCYPFYELPFGKNSMSRKGNCWNNAVAECFFKSLKVEWIYKHKYQYRSQDELLIFSWIENWYNKK